MQTRKPGLRVLSLALAGVLTLGLAACDETKVVQPQLPTGLTISPSGQVDLNVGDRITIAANLTNGPVGSTVAWASSNSAVATVDASGTVTAVAPGIATITATATGNQGTVTQAVAVRVAGGGPVQPGDTAASVVIEGLVGNNNQPIDRTNAAGTVILRMEVERGQADSLVVTLGDRVVCRQVFDGPATAALPAGVSAAQAQALFTCPINTAAYDSTTFAARFANGNSPIVAALYNGGAAVATARINDLTLANTDAAVVSVDVDNGTDPETATDETGVIWAGGTVIVNGGFVSYSGAQASTIQVELEVPGTNPSKSATISNNRFSATFSQDTLPASGGVRGVEGDAAPDLGQVLTGNGQIINYVQIDRPAPFQSVEQRTVDGQLFFAAFFRLDNDAPVYAQPVTFDTRFVNGPFAFSSIVTATGDPGNPNNRNVVDEGVDRVAFTFYVGMPSQTAAQVIAGGSTITTGNDLDATNVSTARKLVIVARDQLGNQTIISTNTIDPALDPDGIRFGVDKVNPTLTLAAGSPANMAVFEIDPDEAPAPSAPATYVFSVSDDVSGFSTTPVSVRVIRHLPGAADACVIGDEDADPNSPATPASDADSDCEATPYNQTTITVPATQGYYEVEVTAVDQAGNMSTMVSRMALVDDTAPTVSNIAIPATLTGGASTTFTATAADNIDVATAQARLMYDDVGIELPFNQPTSYGTFGFDVYTRSVNLSETIPFIRALADSPGGANDAVDAVSFRVTDLPGFAAMQRNDFAAGTVGASDGVDNVGAGNPFTITEPSMAVNLCSGTPGAGACATDDDTSVTIEAEITGQAGTFDNPFRTVYFYYVDGMGVVRLLGTASGTSVTDTGAGPNGRTWTYTYTWNVAGLAAQSNVRVFAVGADMEGDALKTPDNTNITIRR